VVFAVENLDSPKQAPQFAGNPRISTPIAQIFLRLLNRIGISEGDLPA